MASTGEELSERYTRCRSAKCSVKPDILLPAEQLSKDDNFHSVKSESAIGRAFNVEAGFPQN
jgi:hypothetical protein